MIVGVNDILIEGFIDGSGLVTRWTVRTNLGDYIRLDGSVHPDGEDGYPLYTKYNDALTSAQRFYSRNPRRFRGG